MDSGKVANQIDPNKAMQMVKDANTSPADIDALMRYFVANVHIVDQCNLAAKTKNQQALRIFCRSRKLPIRRALASNTNLHLAQLLRLTESNDKPTAARAWETLHRQQHLQARQLRNQQHKE